MNRRIPYLLAFSIFAVVFVAYLLPNASLLAETRRLMGFYPIWVIIQALAPAIVAAGGTVALVSIGGWNRIISVVVTVAPSFFIWASSVMLIYAIGVTVTGLLLYVAIALISSAIFYMVRSSRIRNKYDDRTAEQLVNRALWQNMTGEQLRDSKGKPDKIDNEVTRTVEREIWHYGKINKNRYRLSVYVDNGHVTGWNQAG